MLKGANGVYRGPGGAKGEAKYEAHYEACIYKVLINYYHAHPEIQMAKKQILKDPRNN